jgi:hypothetical protein
MKEMMKFKMSVTSVDWLRKLIAVDDDVCEIILCSTCDFGTDCDDGDGGEGIETVAVLWLLFCTLLECPDNDGDVQLLETGGCCFFFNAS